MSVNRRKFLQQSAVAGAGLALGLPASAQRRIIGANDRLRVAVLGTNSRGLQLVNSFLTVDNCEIAAIGDVDTRAITKGQKQAKEAGQQAVPKGEQDFRRLLEDSDIDIIAIATPDHWHAPMAIMALQAGKHVYVEKPCSHNPHEGELLIAAQAKSGLVCQMGNQQRSSRTSNEVIRAIHDGLIGKPYYAKAWYANTRGGIGTGQVAPVPEWLDYELWQGPAPRRPYQDNLIHYNWHWFWHWGTGELLNNGTHEIDICRWALQVDFPERVSSNGGRYHFEDDWEAYDIQDVCYEFPGGKMINWEGRSCNGMRFWGRGRGALIHGTEGTVLIDRDGYEVYDLGGKLQREAKEGGSSVSMDTAGGGTLDENHAANMAAAIRTGAPLNSPIEDANTSVTICHLGNIAHRVGRTLETDPQTGHVRHDPVAEALWRREYEPGWEPIV